MIGTLHLLVAVVITRGHIEIIALLCKAINMLTEQLFPDLYPGSRVMHL